uniref:Uncharacterized protein n=1 Tax=Rangifer tarandus platyrhynchus TaxID=3082113 RepID=A0ACB0E0Q7_RANTA|nr:unnamed protein product [Rangifer tarandus platyrhynchus]
MHCHVPRSDRSATSRPHIWMRRHLSPQSGGEAGDPEVQAPPRARGRAGPRACVPACARAQRPREPRLRDRGMGVGAQQGLNLRRPPRASLRVNNQPVRESGG